MPALGDGVVSDDAYRFSGAPEVRLAGIVWHVDRLIAAFEEFTPRVISPERMRSRLWRRI